MNFKLKKESLPAKDLLHSNDKKNRWFGVACLAIGKIAAERRGAARAAIRASLVRVKGDVSPSIFSIPSRD